VTLLATVLVAAGGGLGAGGRFLLDGAVTARTAARRPGRAPLVPPGTLVVNALGALVLGVLAGLAPTGPTPAWLLFGGTGVCGGFTTFSTATVETVRAAVDGRWRAAGATAVAHLAVSLVAVALGLALGLALTHHR
jgi:CrcB protein